MSLLTTLLLPALVLTTTPAASTLAPQQVPEIPAAELEARSQAAKLAYKAQHYREAARIYEGLWRDTNAPKYLFNAGMARSAANHDAFALLHLRRYLDLADVPAKERAEVEAQIASISQGTGPVTVRFEPALTADATLTLINADDEVAVVATAPLQLAVEPGRWQLRHTMPGEAPTLLAFEMPADRPPGAYTMTLPTRDADPPGLLPHTPKPELPAATPTHPVRVELVATPGWLAKRRPVTAALLPTNDANTSPPASPPSQVITWPQTTATFAVPAGAWVVRTQGPGLLQTTKRFTTTADGAPPVQVRLRLAPSEKLRLGLGFGFGGAGAVLAGAGVAQLVRSRTDGVCIDNQSCQSVANAALDRSIAFSLFGASLGAVISAGVAGSKRAPRKNSLLAVQAGIGATIFAGSLAAYLGQRLNTTALDYPGREQAAAFFMGLGASSLGGAAIALISRRIVQGPLWPRAAANNASITPTARGLALSARF